MILEKQDKSLNLTDRTFCLGEKVLVKNDIRNKDEARYEGPYTIIEIIHERSYRMINTNGRVLVRNVEWLKRFKKGGVRNYYLNKYVNQIIII